MSDTSSGPAPEILSHAGQVTGTTTVLPAGDGEVPGHRRAGPRRGLVIGAAVAGTALVCGAGFAAASLLSGGGTQPEDVLPAGVVAYADVDLDPAAGQKVDALRFLRRLPQVTQAAGGADDLRGLLVEGVLGRSGVDPAQVTPWLGDRAGVAVVRDGGDLQVVAAVQTTDTEQARATLSRLMAGAGDGGSAPGFAVSGDYVVIASSAAEAQRVVTEGQASPLSADAAFTTALDGFGDGVASFYLDGSALRGVTSVEGQPVPAGQLAQLTTAGTTAGIVRFEPDALELLARSTGADTRAVAGEPTNLVTTLPDTTVLALGAASDTGAEGHGIQRLLTRLDAVTGMDTAAMVQRRFGLRLPADALTFFGRDRVLAVDGGDAATMAGMPSIGYRSVTDPTAAAGLLGRLDPLVRQLTGGFGLVTRTTRDGLVVATTPQYAAQLAAGEGSLGSSAAFRRAVPDAGSAAAVGYLDLDRLAAVLHTLSPDADTSALDALRAVGFSVADDQGTTELRLRLTLG